MDQQNGRMDTGKEKVDQGPRGVYRRKEMKYSREERLAIGREVYEGELSKQEAAEKYEIGEESARKYMRLYRDVYNLPPKEQAHPRRGITQMPKLRRPIELAELEGMSREELIQEVIRARISEARAKKGYEVKGDGGEKEYIVYGNRSTK